MNLFKVVFYLPILNIPFAPGGKIVIRGASYNGLGFLCGVIIVVGVFGWSYFRMWYIQHPILGKLILLVVAWWVLCQIVRFFQVLCDDPYTRRTPYRNIEPVEISSKQVDLLEENKISESEKDKTHA
ncbi:MAG: hypothetical protein IJ876_07480 [Elusimicrobiaceae bacterium]|nr:hypothetical protein [Elusimicrobiaceae bacterium]